MFNKLSDYEDALKRAWDLQATIDDMLDRACGSETAEEYLLGEMERRAREIRDELAGVCTSMKKGAE